MITEESGKMLFIAVLAVVVVTVIVAVAIVFSNSAPEAKVPGVCDVVEGKVDSTAGSVAGKAVCFPLKAASWTAGQIGGLFR